MKKRKRKKNHFVSKCLSKEEQEYIIKLFKTYTDDYRYRKLGWSLLYKTYCNEYIEVTCYYSLRNIKEIPFDEYIRRLAQQYYAYSINSQTFPLRELRDTFKQLRKYGTIWKPNR